MTDANRNPSIPQSAYVDVDTGHDYDGIRELDNRLPNWWLFTLWSTVLFGGAYWIYFESSGLGLSSAEQLALEYEAIEAAAAKAGPAADAVSEDTLLALAQDAAAVERGHAQFTQSCAACHKADGGGLIGPNLTDGFFIHGADAKSTYDVIAEGVAAKGMPAWKPQLGAAKVKDLTAFVLTLRASPVADGKEPQGEPAGGAKGAKDAPADDDRSAG